MRFLPYEPNQAWLLPPSVKDVLGANHLCFFVHRVVEDVRRRVKAGREFQDAVREVLAANAQLLVLARKQRRKER